MSYSLLWVANSQTLRTPGLNRPPKKVTKSSHKLEVYHGHIDGRPLNNIAPLYSMLQLYFNLLTDNNNNNNTVFHTCNFFRTHKSNQC